MLNFIHNSSGLAANLEFKEMVYASGTKNNIYLISNIAIFLRVVANDCYAVAVQSIRLFLIVNSNVNENTSYLK